MFRRLLIAAGLLAGLAASAPAPADDMPLMGVSQGVVTAGCSQATTFLASATGMSSADNAAYTTLICGIVNSGVSMDVVYVFAAPTAAISKLNLINPGTYNATWNNSVLLDSNVGVFGDANGAYISTGYNPGAGGANYSQNSASWGLCVLNQGNTSTAINAGVFGMTEGSATTNYNYLQFGSGLNYYWGIAATTYTAVTSGPGYGSGSWIATRTSSGSQTLYRNGSSVSSASTASSAIYSAAWYLSAENVIGTGVTDYSGNTLAYWWAGSGATSTQVATLRSLFNTFLATRHLQPVC